ncbi:hypothetical protein [Inquilinus sp. CAU 1745]|uniref:hypothetical protein n=1 Tax=Inquilinus sp. CAU 1745 TaxID=3140369 RepID=UPI00325C2F45
MAMARSRTQAEPPDDLSAVLRRIEPVLSALTDEVAGMRKELAAVKLDVAELKGRVSSTPTGLQLIAINFTTIIAVFGLSVAMVSLIR